MSVALVSCLKLPEPDPDQDPLSAALHAAGVEARVLAWDDPDVDWSRADLTVLRSSWNYPLRPADFLAWAEATSTVTRLWNPLPVVRWNLHKRYLLELEQRGLPVTPTELVARGSQARLADVMQRRGWSEVVVKPAISACSYRTIRIARASVEQGERHLRALAESADVLVQRYLDSVEGHGERSLIWIDGELTHAVRKSPRFSDQQQAVSEALPISAAERDLALRTLATIEEPILYARVDVAPGPDGRPVIMELELIEPSLFFIRHPPALDRFVGALSSRL